MTRLMRSVLTLLGLLLLAWGPALPAAADGPAPTPLYQHGPGRAERFHGVYLVHLYGTPYEMGFQHGAMFKQELKQFRTDSLSYLVGYARRLTGLPEWMLKPLVNPVVRYWTRQFLPSIPAEYQEEMRGMAEASGVPFIEVVMLNAIWELAEFHACSEFAVAGPATQQGRLWHGYNFDLMDPDQDFIDPYKALIFYHPTDRKSFASVSYIGYVGVWTGMNQDGISLAWDNTVLNKSAGTRAELKKARRIPEPFVFAIRRVMEQAGNLDEATSIMAELRRPLADIVIIASRDENSAVAMETFSTRTVVRPMENGAVWSANCFASQEMGAFDHGHGALAAWARGELSGDAPELMKKSYSRHLRYAELIKQYHGNIGLAQILAILRDPYPVEAKGGIYEGERTIGVDRTNFSAIFNLSDMVLWAALGRTPSPFDFWVGVDFATEKPVARGDWPALIPATAFFETRQGYLDMIKGEYGAALSNFERALAIEPENYRVRAWRLHALSAAGKVTELEAAVDSFNSFFPESRATAANLPPLPPPFRAIKVPEGKAGPDRKSSCAQCPGTK